MLPFSGIGKALKILTLSQLIRNSYHHTTDQSPIDNIMF